MASTHALLTDAEIHGLVDGRLEGDKRSEILRRLAASAVDRHRVEVWQEQNELIRGAFSAVEKEPLPVALNLAAPHMHAVGMGDAPISAAIEHAPRSRALAGMAATLIVLAGLGGLWLMFDTAERDGPAMGPTIGMGLRASIDDTLAERADAALDRDTTAAVVVAQGTLPITEIPDLSPAGFVFASAEASEPDALLFHYRKAADRLVVGVSRATRTSSPSRSGRTMGWRHGANAYAVAGTMAPEKLRVIAALLQGGAPAN